MKGEEGKLEEPLHTQRFLVLGRFAVSFYMGNTRVNEQRKLKILMEFASKSILLNQPPVKAIRLLREREEDGTWMGWRRQ